MMKPILTLALFIASLGIAKAQDSAADILSRLSYYDASHCRKSIDALKKSFPGKFVPPTNYEKTLADLAEKKSSLIDKLNGGDPVAIVAAKKLLNDLDAIFRENPLIKGKKIGVVRRNIGQKARMALGGAIGVGPSNFQNNSELARFGWKNQMMELIIDSKGIGEKKLYEPEKDVLISDLEPHFDGKRILYSSIGTNDRWQLFEFDLFTGKAKQVTPQVYADFDSFDGCYTPDGRYIFCSTGTFLGLPCTDGGNKMCGLFSYDPKTGTTRQLTFDQDSNWGPVVMNNGQILYQRWEYADLAHSNSRLIFTMNPDGTSQRAYYKSNSYFPTAFFNSRPIPNHPTAFVGTASGHHSVARSGRLLIIDPVLGTKEAEGVVAEVPYSGRKVEAIVRDRLPDGIYPQFLQPFPLNENYFLVSVKLTPNSLWGIYLVDRFDNMTLIKQEEECAYVEPVLIEKKPVPPSIPDRTNLAKGTANVFIQDIYNGDGLKGIPRGTVKKLRVGTYSFSPWGQGGLLGTFGLDGPWDIKLVMGTVNVESDGSALFTVPANTPIFIQPLDSEGKAVQLMRSWFTGMPGETVSCLGCHESRNTIPVPKANLASRKKPQEIEQWYGKQRGFSYRHEIQPILDKYCVSCHDESGSDRPYLKGDKMITDYKSEIAGSVSAKSGGGNFSESYYQLQRYVRRPGIESDLHMLTPMDYHADQTELMQLLNKGHHNVKLDRESIEKLSCWIDFNAQYHGRRSDVLSYRRSLPSIELRKKYLDLFHAPKTNIEELPELPGKIEPVRPVKITSELGVTTLQGWPLANPTEEQIKLGFFQQRFRLSDDVTLEMVKVPAGEFLMGSRNHPDEMPMTKVKIEKPFWIGRFEITNKQYQQFDPSHDSRFEARHGYQFGRLGYPLNHPDQPVVRVSWKEANEFCKWLSTKMGKKFVLPTEAQWEWACRSGSDNDFFFGNLGSDFSKYANLGDVTLKEFAACTAFKFYESVRIIDHPNRYDDWVPHDTTYDDREFVSAQIGRYRNNNWELNDMIGNVWEWTRSEYKPYPYRDMDGRNDGANEGAVKNRVVRGGSWYDRPVHGTASYRLMYRDYQKVFDVGFRVVMEE